MYPDTGDGISTSALPSTESTKSLLTTLLMGWGFDIFLAASVDLGVPAFIGIFDPGGVMLLDRFVRIDVLPGLANALRNFVFASHKFSLKIR
jgi:hypothetical protein